MKQQPFENKRQKYFYLASLYIIGSGLVLALPLCAGVMITVKFLQKVGLLHEEG